MKKRVLLIAAIFMAGATFAQDQLTSKKGTPILPEAGDYAIGFDAAGVTSYFGNLMNGTQTNAIGGLGLQNNGFNNNQNLTIYGKKFIAADKAYRAMVRVGFGSNSFTTMVPDANDATKQVEDVVKTSNMNITLGGGIEMRRGKGRLQGVYGPMAAITIGSGPNITNEWGNDLVAGSGATRQKENKAGGTFGISVGGFAGVEYFFAPKMSVGGEIGWSILYQSQGNGEVVTEVEGAADTTVETGGNSGFGVDTRPMGNLSINFHF